MITIRLLIIIVSFIFFYSDSHAQEWNVRPFAPPNGKTFGDVRDIVKSSDNSIWFASWGNGVARLKGSEWRVFTSKEGLTSNIVTSVESDVNKGIWATTDSGICHISMDGTTQVFSQENISIMDDPYFSEVKRMNNGEIWFGSGSGSIIGCATSGIKRLISDRAEEIVVRGYRWYKVKQASINKDFIRDINDIFISKDEGIWVTTVSDGIYRLIDFHWEKISVDNFAKKSIAQDTNGKIWHVADSLSFRDGNGWTKLKIQIKDRDIGGEKLEITPSDQIFLVDDSGVFYKNKNKWNYCSYSEEIGLPDPRTIFFGDSEHGWIGTKEGILEIYLHRFQKINPPPQKGNSEYYDYFLSKGTAPLCINNNFNLFQYDDNQWKPILQLPEDPSRNYLVSQSMNGKFWIYSNDMFFQIALNKKRIVRTIKKPDGIQIIRMLYTSKEELILCGKKGVYILRDEQWSLLHDRNYENQEITYISETQNGSYLVCEKINSKKFNVELWQEDNIKVLFSDKYPLTFAVESRDKRIWIGTPANGTFILEKGQIINLTTDDGINSNRVFKFHETSNGTYWIGSDYVGLSSCSNETWIDFSNSQGFEKGFINEINEYPDNVIWINTKNNNNLYRYIPDRNPPDSKIEKASRSIQYNGIGIFTFSGYDYWNHTPVEDLLYSWRIVDNNNDKSNTEWSSFQFKNSVNIGKQSAGSYRFEVRAADLDRNIDFTPDSSPFEVLSPPIQNRWWFLYLIVAIFIIIIFLALSAFISQLKVTAYSDNLEIKIENRTLKLKHEVEERKKTEAELRTSQTHLEKAQKVAHIGSWESDLLTNDLLWTQESYEIFGISADEFDGKRETFLALVHPDDQESVSETSLAAITGDRPYRVEHRIVRPNGEVRWVYEQAEIIKDENGSPIKMIGTIQDITERKQAEEELRKTHERLNAIMQSVQAGIILVCGENRVIIEANAAAARMAGVTQESLIGKICNEHICPAGVGLCPVFDLGQTVDNSEHSIRRADGTIIPILKTATYLQIDGKDHLLESFVDITELKEAKNQLEQVNASLEESIQRANQMTMQAEAANIAKSQFLANMSHEIRTPMNGIIGMTSLLMGTDLREEQRHFTEIIQSSGKSLLDLINDILDFSKIEADHLNLEMMDFNLRIASDEFCDLLALRVQEKGLEFIFGINPDVPVYLMGDPGRLRQILINLTGNAVKFTSAGEIDIRVSLEEENERQATLRFTIRDTGIGIPKDKMHLLFDAFQQVDSSTSRKYGGTGLGLAISKRLSELMGGQIGVESQEGKGSTFWFTVVLGKQDASKHDMHAPDLESLKDKRILIVDDNATNRELLRLMLGAWGVQCEEAESGDGALLLLCQAHDAGHPYQISILDMQMPGMDGEELALAIQAIPSIKHTLLVMMSSIAQRGDATRFEQAGFSAYLTKPVKQNDLHDCLATVLGRSAIQKTPQENMSSIITRHTIREDKRAKYRILLAEDNITNQKVALSILNKLGYKADAVANGQEAIQASAMGRYDLILMDVQMPVLDGFEATAAIRTGSANAPNPNLPIIAMTAHAMKGDRENCIAHGMDDYISKPVEPEALEDILGKWLSQITGSPNDKTPVQSASVESPLEKESPIVLDKKALRHRLMNDDELIQTILTGFLEDIPQQIKLLETYIETNDASSAERQAHTIKGAAANVGGEALRAIAYEMEKDGQAGNLVAMKSNLEEIKQQFETLAALIAKDV